MRTTTYLAILISAASILPIPVSAQSNDQWHDFWEAIGGSENVDRVGNDSLIARPLWDNADEITGARFFKERGSSDPMAVTQRSLRSFEQSCRTQGGSVPAADDARTVSFDERVIAHLVQPTGMRHQWRGQVAICDGSDGAPIAGFVSLVKDNSEIHRSGDAGSQLIGGLFGGLWNTTAIYLFRADRLPTATDATVLSSVEERGGCRCRGEHARSAAGGGGIPSQSGDG